MYTSLNHYIGRYLPSKERLKRFCTKRRIQMPLYDETPALKERLTYYELRWYPKKICRTKLRWQWFLEKNIEALIAWSNMNFELLKKRICDRIVVWLRRWKSKAHISYALEYDYPEFQDEIRILMQEYDDRESLEYMIERVRHKFKSNENRKMIHALIQKWFTMHDIRAFLWENEDM